MGSVPRGLGVSNQKQTQNTTRHGSLVYSADPRDWSLPELRPSDSIFTTIYLPPRLFKGRT